MRSILEIYLLDKLLLLSAMDLAMLLKLLVKFIIFLVLTLCLLDVPADKSSSEKVLYTYLHG